MGKRPVWPVQTKVEAALEMTQLVGIKGELWEHWIELGVNAGQLIQLCVEITMFTPAASWVDVWNLVLLSTGNTMAR